MSSQIQFTFNKSGNKFHEINSMKEFTTFRDFVYEKFKLVAAEFYFIDEHNFDHLVENQKTFNDILEANLHNEIKFYIEENVEGSDKLAGFKSDLRNLKFNDDYADMRNDKKSRNTLEILKKERGKIKNKLKEVTRKNKKRCSIECPCEINQNIVNMESALKEFEVFHKNRLAKKFWKKSKEFRVREKDLREKDFNEKELLLA